MPKLHSTAQIDANAEIGADVEIGAYSVIGKDVRIGDGTRIGPHVVITGRTTIGARNRIFQFASIGDIPQDRKYGGEPTTLTIGDDNVIREYVSIHAGTAQDRGTTTVGDRNWLLAYVHIAHDCRVGNDTTFSNNSQLAGHVSIDDYATLGGFTGVHQFCRVGAHAMIAAGSIVLQDVPPFMTVSGYPAKAAATNNEGLRRRGFSASDIAAVRRAYKLLYREGLSLADAKESIAQAANAHPVLAPLVAFLAEPGRGIVRTTRETPDL
jgi:UDP-N-acetylglucosamine acyltransferase